MESFTLNTMKLREIDKNYLTVLVDMYSREGKVSRQKPNKLSL